MLLILPVLLIIARGRSAQCVADPEFASPRRRISCIRRSPRPGPTPSWPSRYDVRHAHRVLAVRTKWGLRKNLVLRDHGRPPGGTRAIPWNIPLMIKRVVVRCITLRKHLPLWVAGVVESHPSGYPAGLIRVL